MHAKGAPNNLKDCSGFSPGNPIGFHGRLNWGACPLRIMRMPAQKKKPTTKKKNNNRLQRKPYIPPVIVGIGASAGGLEALEGLFTHLPDVPNNFAFVVIQHLSTKVQSHMDEIFERFSKLKVCFIKDGMKVEPGAIYLNVPGKNVAIQNRILHLTEMDNTQDHKLPIDLFFESLAQDQGERAICIILSGTGSDGTQGLKAIKGHGGITVVQDEAQARHASMPTSAVETGMVDLILPVEKVGQELMVIEKHPYLKVGYSSTGPEVMDSDLSKIFRAIRSATGHDFSNYKKATIFRRIQRRMALQQLSDIKEYIHFLEKDDNEKEFLARDLCIRITNFFRDKSAFEALKKEVVYNLLKDAKENAPVRIWVPGCGTGEEAYSLAMVFSEASQDFKKYFNVQIFATDIDAQSIDYARRAVYPETIKGEVSPERLENFFIKEKNAYRVIPNIRQMVVFAVQNIVSDPSFTRLDLISCRNILIYLEKEMQNRIFYNFHFNLKDNGFLFLGNSESVGELHELFEVIDGKAKIFRRKAYVNEGEYEKFTFSPLSSLGPLSVKDVIPEEIHRMNNEQVRQLAEKLILEQYAPACVFLDKDYNVLYFHGDTDLFFSLPTGKPSLNFLKIIRSDLHYEVSNMLRQIYKAKEPVLSKEIYCKRGSHELNIRVHVKRVVVAGQKEDLLMVSFAIQQPSQKQIEKVHFSTKTDPRILALEQELQAQKIYLQSTVEELETSREELKSANEELQSANEELQSTNEELESSREELQSGNEELATINSELNLKIEELIRAKEDFENLLSTTAVGTIFLDTEMRIKLFTPAASRIFHLIDGDIGRLISDLNPLMDYKKIFADCKQVLETLQMKEFQIQTTDGAWFGARILPYRSLNNVIAGVVLTFIDITYIKDAEIVRERLAKIINNTSDAVIFLGVDGKIIDWNKGAMDLYGYSKEEALAMNIAQIEHPSTKLKFSEIGQKLKKKAQGLSFTSKRRSKDGQILEVLTVATRDVNLKGQISGVVCIERDITTTAQDKIKEEASLCEKIFKTIHLGMLIWRLEEPQNIKSFRLILANEAASKIIGTDMQKLVGKTMFECFPNLYETAEPQNFMDIVKNRLSLELSDFQYADKKINQNRVLRHAFYLWSDCVAVVLEKQS